MGVFFLGGGGKKGWPGAAPVWEKVKKGGGRAGRKRARRRASARPFFVFVPAFNARAAARAFHKNKREGPWPLPRGLRRKVHTLKMFIVVLE